MKKNVFISLLLVFSLVSLTSSAHRFENDINNPLLKYVMTGVRFDMIGTIGGADAWMEMYGSTGVFEYSGIKRKLKFSSYNRRTGRLIISEYDLKGKYIGKFNGIYKDCDYIGVFTNKKGGKSRFELTECYGD